MFIDYKSWVLKFMWKLKQRKTFFHHLPLSVQAN